MLDSARLTSVSNVEALCYISDCDHSYDGIELDAKVVRGPRLVFSDLWNALIPYATGDIYMQCSDDVVFRTHAWDVEVENAFASVPDRIVLVHADDGGGNDPCFAEFPFVSREWVNAVGYFTGPGFVADMIGRKIYLPHVLIEHMHHVWGKAPLDKTYEENNARYREGRPDLRYQETLPQRLADAEKLRKVMR